MAQQIFASGRKNVLVTGGSGFLGSHLCEMLLKTDNIICLDDFTSSLERNIDHLLQSPYFEFIKLDVNKKINLEELPELERFKINVQGIQEIYHLAWPTSPKNFEKMKIKILKTSSFGVVNMLELARKYKAKFLFSSSFVIYGQRKKDNIYFKEDDFGSVDTMSFQACHDEGKRFAETCIETYRQFYNLDTKILRIFRTYGPKMSLLEGHMTPDFVLQALNNKPLIIYGDENFSSSFCYVSDVVEGMAKMMASKEHGPLNIGQPEEFKMVDLAKKIIEKTNSSSEIIFKPPLSFLRPLGLPEITLIKEKLDWYPVVGLDEGLDKTIKDIKVHQIYLQPLLVEYEKEYNDQEQEINNK